MDVGAYSMWWARQQPQWLVYINDADRLAHVVVSRYQQKCQQTASMLNAGVQRLAAAGRKTLVGTKITRSQNLVCLSHGRSYVAEVNWAGTSARAVDDHGVGRQS